MMKTCPHLTLALALLLVCQSAYGQQSSARSQRSSSAQGVLTPWKVCRVSSSESGLVLEHYVRPGAVVKVGDPLAALDSEQQQLLVQMSKINSQATGKVNSARAEVDLHRRKLASIEAGRKNAFTTQSEFERAEMELRMAEGKLANEIDQHQVEQVNLQKLQLQLQQRTVTAPIAGTVVRMFKEVGEFVAPTSPEIMEIVDISKIRATFYLRAEEVVVLNKLGVAHVQLTDQASLPAELEYVAPIADGESGLIEVRLLINNAERRIVGSSCTLLLDPADEPKHQT